MWGGDTETTTQTNAPSNPDVNPTLSKLLQGVQGQYDKSQAWGTPEQMASGWNVRARAAENPAYTSSIRDATSSFGDAAAGNDYSANDPYYKQLGDDTLRDVNSMFTTSGRFGSGSHVDTAVKALGDVNNANIGADRAWQSQAAQMMPSLFAAGQAPGETITGIGREQQAAPWYNLGQASSILSGTAGAGGSTSTSTTPATPWWQTGASLLGQFI